jgi:hypothetical protein
MTNEQCIRQIKKLMGTWQQGGLHVLLDECKNLLTCGGIDIQEDAPDSLLPAKIVLHVALLDMAENLRPLSKGGNEIAENLKHF